MPRLVHVGAVLLLLGGVTSAVSAPPAHAANSRPQAWISPTRVKNGGLATVHGARLRANTTYTVLLAVPSNKKGAFKRLVALVRTDGSGVLDRKVALPLSKTCGSASLYLFPFRAQTTIRVRFTLTGCHAGSGTVTPPPPPGAPPTPKPRKKKP